MTPAVLLPLKRAGDRGRDDSATPRTVGVEPITILPDDPDPVRNLIAKPPSTTGGSDSLHFALVALTRIDISPQARLLLL